MSGTETGRIMHISQPPIAESKLLVQQCIALSHHGLLPIDAGQNIAWQNQKKQRRRLNLLRTVMHNASVYHHDIARLGSSQLSG